MRVGHIRLLLPYPPDPIPHQSQPFELGHVGIGGDLLPAAEVVMETGVEDEAFLALWPVGLRHHQFP